MISVFNPSHCRSDSSCFVQRKVGDQGAAIRQHLAAFSAQRKSRLHGQLALGMNPGMPVFTTGLSLTRVLIPSLICLIASSGRVEISKFSSM